MAKSRLTSSPQSPLRTLLAVCKANADDDVPRLALADWLQQQRDPRGEYVQLQVEQARTRRDRPLYFPHQAWLHKLEKLHGEAWFGPLRRVCSYCSSHRGLIHSLVDVRTMLGEEFATVAASDEFAWVESLEFFYGDASTDEVRRALAHPCLAHISSMSLLLVEPQGKVYLRFLGNAPHLKSLRKLRLNECRASMLNTLLQVPALADGPNLELFLLNIPNTGLRALTASPLWPRLTHLELKGERSLRKAGADILARAPAAKLRSLLLGYNHIGDEGIALLASSTLFDHCEELELRWNDITDFGLAALARCSGLGRLRSLDLALNRRLRATGLRALAMSSHLAGLERLDLNEIRLGPKGAEALAAGLPRLNVLNLGTSAIGDEGLAALARASWNDLRVLYLTSNRIGDIGLEALARHHQGKNLRCLHLWYNKIGSRGLLALADSPLLRRLSGLRLDENQVGDDGVQALTEGEPVNLLELELDKNGVGPNGATRLAGCARLRRLRRLSLRGNPIGDKGVKALAESPFLTKLDALLLDRVGMTPDGAAALVASKYLPRRMTLHVSGDKLGSKARAALRERFARVEP